MFLSSGGVTDAPPELTPALAEKRGVFVTILSLSAHDEYAATELRGCIGYLEARLRLVDATIRAAISAATGDPRFPPMVAEELPTVVFEINALSEFQHLEAKNRSQYPKMINIGADGLMIQNGLNRGLLLPGVPVEWKWNEEEFLAECCLKAGLPPDAWLDKKTVISKFQSEIFREIKPSGKTRRILLQSGAASDT